MNLAGVNEVDHRIAVKSVVVSPSEVEDKIEEAFIRNARMDAERIEVNVTDHAVTLTGSVRSRAEREAAERATWSVLGVDLVDDRLVVR